MIFVDCHSDLWYSRLRLIRLLGLGFYSFHDLFIPELVSGKRQQRVWRRMHVILLASNSKSACHWGFDCWSADFIWFPDHVLALSIPFERHVPQWIRCFKGSTTLPDRLNSMGGGPDRNFIWLCQWTLTNWMVTAPWCVRLSRWWNHSPTSTLRTSLKQ